MARHACSSHVRRPIYLRWHFQQVISRLVLGGRVPELDKEYTIGAFFKVYFLSCCGLLAGKINVFVDSHIMFDMSKTLKVKSSVKLITET
jgi:hypothetical protein